jgi:hypothetical protein
MKSTKKRGISQVFPTSKRIGSKRLKFNPVGEPCLKCQKNFCEGWLCPSCEGKMAETRDQFVEHFEGDEESTAQSSQISKTKIRKSQSVKAYFKSSKNKSKIELFVIDELEEDSK